MFQCDSCKGKNETVPFPLCVCALKCVACNAFVVVMIWMLSGEGPVLDQLVHDSHCKEFLLVYSWLLVFLSMVVQVHSKDWLVTEQHSYHWSHTQCCISVSFLLCE